MGTAKTYLAKILHTTESTAMTAMGRKVTMAVSTGARRRGQERRGGRFYFAERHKQRKDKDGSGWSKRLKGRVPTAVHNRANGGK
jgi:hypothetical protein